MLSATAARADLGYLAGRHRIAPFTLHRPATVAEASELLERYGPQAAAMGGGVDLSTRLKRGDRIDHVVYLGHAADLTAIEHDGGWLRVGAAVTHNQFAKDPAVARHLGDLAAVWRTLGNPRVRAMGTLGGNLITAAPHYDVAPLVAAAGGRVAYHSESQLLLSHIDFPIGTRLALGYETAYKPVVSVAVAMREDRTGIWRGTTAVGCAYPEPVIAGFGGEIEWRDVDGVSADVARSAVRELPEPVDDHVASAAYRRRLIEVLIRRLLLEIVVRRVTNGASP